MRVHLNVVPYAEAGERLITATVLEAAATMSDPADLIGRAIEALGKARPICRPSARSTGW